PEGIPAAADIVNLRYKSCSEMEGQDQTREISAIRAETVRSIVKPDVTLAVKDHAALQQKADTLLR
ncbi:MAG: hypothetical protein E6054_17205, partial [Klebsiella michiganensis]|nr:hypothetical protein [Klebsiella michiganensis]